MTKSEYRSPNSSLPHIYSLRHTVTFTHMHSHILTYIHTLIHTHIHMLSLSLILFSFTKANNPLFMYPAGLLGFTLVVSRSIAI